MKGLIFHFLSLFLIVTLYCSCVWREDQRNQLTFQDSVEEVERSIQSINELLKRIQPSANVSNYFFDSDGNLYVNSTNIGKPDEVLVDTVKVLRDISSEERKVFVNMATFLKRNKIDGCHLEGLFDTWIYSYNRTVDDSFRNYRGIFYQTPSTPIEDIIQSNEILDKEGNLVLFRAN